MIGRMVSGSRPSTRSPFSSTCFRMVRYSISSNSLPISFPRSAYSPTSSASDLLLDGLDGGAPAELVLGVDRLGHGSLAQLADPAHQRFVDAGLLPLELLRLRALLTSCCSRPTSSWMPRCATLSASSISASEISSAPPSTITIESAEPLDGEVDGGELELLERRIQDPVAVHPPDAHRGERPFQGTSRC